jgi:hemoglobin
MTDSKLPTPYEQLGGRERVIALAQCFYDVMEQTEPELTAIHDLEHGKVSARSRERFALFLVGWLGGPQDYIAQNGHPRLRMRHARVAIDSFMRDAWLRAMAGAMDKQEIRGEIRAFLDTRFRELADFMRNTADQKRQASSETSQSDPSRVTRSQQPTEEPGITLRRRSDT